MIRNWVTGEYICGNRISKYGIDNGYVDYETLAKCFGHVLNNDIIEYACKHDIYPELVNGFEYIDNDPDNDPIEFYQYYIIDNAGVELLQDMTNETVYYIPDLDLYVWAIAHYGTAWDMVLTEIRCNYHPD